MATLILTTVGAAIGGPIGAVLGSALGGYVDRTVLFPPKGREGPRLTELAVQTSSYGTQIPQLFGTMRVAGTVIWSTDLIESRSTGRSGKGQPSVTSYSYSASFAVLLSARPIREVRRIWAEGKLLRGAAGDLKVQTGFRVHSGVEDQAPDPLIAAAHPGDAPAFRGCAYAVFENLQLADYGNRIPSLTFEVVADDGPVALATIVTALAPELAADAALRLDGFAASGTSVAGVLETLGELAGASVGDARGRLTMRDEPDGYTIAADAGVAAKGRGATGRRARTSIESLPRTVSISHYDPMRDYQIGLQRATRPGAGSRDMRLEAPAVIDGGTAKAIAGAALLRAEAVRETRTITLGFAGLALAPGDGVSLAGEDRRWRVRDSSVEDLVTAITLEAVGDGTPPADGDSGTVRHAPDMVIGPTLLEIAELPALDDVPLTAPQISVFATGAAGWRGAALLLSVDDGASWQAVGATAAPAIIGTIEQPPIAGPAAIEDDQAMLLVRLARPDDALADADRMQLDNGANLALVGEELLQFGRAEPLGNDRWRLSGLRRGRRGTEACIGTQRAEDRFVLIEREGAMLIPLPVTAIGGTARLMASGVGDLDGPAERRVPITGRSAAPPSPVRPELARLGDGGAALRWTRRSRAGWRWIDGVDVPLGEETERYRVTLRRGDGDRSIETSTAALTLTPADMAGLSAIDIRQIGTVTASPPATLSVQGS